MQKNLPHFLIGFGVFIALFFLLADYLGIGKPGIQATQILGILFGILIGVAGFIWRTLQGRSNFSFGKIFAPMRELPALVWVILGMFPAFVLYFITPMFFDRSHRIQYPVDYIRQIVPIGIDMQSMLGAIDLWLKSGQTNQYVFTPLVNLLFAPLLVLKYPLSYYVITFITLASYLILTLLAVLTSDAKNRSAAIVICFISIFSYGLMFELERGQTYTLSLALCLLAIYLFHWQRDFRWLAYILFCVAVQLKFYPALLVLLFVDDWRDWKNTLLRFAALGITNILLLFLFGMSYFSAFYNSLVSGVASGEAAVVNHSIKSFVEMLSSSEWDLFRGSSARWIQNNSGMLSAALYFYFLICFAVVLIGAWIRNDAGFNPNLILVCVVGSLVLPSVNHDYTLAMLTAPFAMAVVHWHTPEISRSRIITVVLTISASFAYAVILIPHVFKPLYLKNSLPLIFIILTAVAIQNILSRKMVAQKTG